MKFIGILSIITLLFTSCASSRPWTKQEKLAATFNIAGIMADAYSTKHMLTNPNNHELNPILGKHPTNSQLAIYFPLTAIITLGLSHFYPDFREPLLFGYGGLSFGAAIHNSQLD